MGFPILVRWHLYIESGPRTSLLSQGMKRFDARKAVLQALTEQGLIKETVDHAMTIPVCRWVGQKAGSQITQTIWRTSIRFWSDMKVWDRCLIDNDPKVCVFWAYAVIFCQLWCVIINLLRPRQNDLDFAGDIYKWIFLNENVRIFIKIWLKFVLKSPVDNIPALVQMMAWHRPGNKPLSEPMKVNLLT